MVTLEYLFETHALKVAPADQPFWYTSGLIGPFYINTHFLCGGEKTANEVLDYIDLAAADKANFPAGITAKLEKVYQEHNIYKKVIDSLCERTKEIIVTEQITHISGGQRRDWFFAPLVAKKLNIPCLYIYNDLSTYSPDSGEVTNLEGTKILNIADLLTAGSSYTGKWIPAISNLGGKLSAALNVVDRAQNGYENLRKAGIQTISSLITINSAFFETALESKLISEAQFDILTDYFSDQHSSMRNWLMENPDFLVNSLQSTNKKTKERAKKLKEEDLYHIYQ